MNEMMKRFLRLTALVMAILMAAMPVSAAYDENPEPQSIIEDEIQLTEDPNDAFVAQQPEDDESDDDEDWDDWDDWDDEEDDEDWEDEEEALEPEEEWDWEDGEPGEPVFTDDGSVYNNVPLYFQTDYPDVRYGSGTMATSGCSMACSAMIVNYLTGKHLRPDDLARRFRNADGSHVQRMEAIATIYDLKFHKTFFFAEVVDALKSGKIVVEMVSGSSLFTNTQHLIVLTGIQCNGTILANDPLETNYSVPELEDGFTSGFDQEILMDGFSGAWIFEPYEPLVPGVNRYADIEMTDRDRELLAKLIWREARGESFAGQQAVAEVILNRVKSDRFPTTTVAGTILAKDQFTTVKFFDDTTPDELQYKAIDMALSGHNVLGEDVFYFSRHFVNNEYICKIGRHSFFGAGA